MLRRIHDGGPPTGWRRVLYAIPRLLYDARLDGLLGSRFLLLTHTGRRSGRTYRTVLEVVRKDDARSTYIVASGFGPRAQWFRNLQAHPETEIRVAGRTMPCVARTLPRPEAETELLDYAHRNPRAARLVARLCGFDTDGSDDDVRELAAHVPLIALEPRAATSSA